MQALSVSVASSACVESSLELFGEGLRSTCAPKTGPLRRWKRTGPAAR